MNTDNTLPMLESGLFTGTISSVQDAGMLVGDITCRWLEPTVGAAPFQVGDQVVVWRQFDSGMGIILGRIQSGVAPVVAAVQTAAPIPDELVLSAKKKLILCCGDGEIVMRGDGKILIRGNDLVAKAKHANRIKGGQVVIN